MLTLYQDLGRVVGISKFNIESEERRYRRVIEVAHFFFFIFRAMEVKHVLPNTAARARDMCIKPDCTGECVDTGESVLCIW